MNSPRPDGRHDVTAWLQFFAAKNVKGAAEDIAGEDERTVKDWKTEELKLKCTKLEIENCKVAGELVDAAEVESGVAVLVGAFRQALNNFAPRLAGKIVGVKDYHEAEEIILEEINIVLRTLQRCDFLKLLESGAPQLAAGIEPSEAQVPISVPVKGTPKASLKKSGAKRGDLGREKIVDPPSAKAKSKQKPKGRARKQRS